MFRRRGPGRGLAASNAGLFVVIFILAILSDGWVMAPMLFAFLGTVAIFGLIVARLFGLIGGERIVKNNKETRINKKVNKMSNADYAKIDKKLNNYFRKNVSLPIINDVALVTSSGSYTALDQLYITYKDEKVAKFAEFRSVYPQMATRIEELILAFANKSNVTVNETKNTEEVKEEVKQAKLTKAQQYIERINVLNAAIPQEEITNGLHQTCDLLNKIEKSKQSHQDKLKIDKLYEYYLPILTGILEKYKNLQDGDNKTDEFKACESQLIKTIMLINQALKNLYDDMHEDDYININADMNTLQTLIEKDGLGSDPFKTTKG